MDSKEKIYLVLHQISKRYSSIFFTKLVLFEHQQQVDNTFIRHYDIECEATNTLVDTLNTKIKAIKFRAFHYIKFFNKNVISRKRTVHSNSFALNKKNNSFYGFKLNQNKSFRQQPSFAKTSRNRAYEGPNEQKSIDAVLEMDTDISSLVQKMKYLNSKFCIKNKNDEPNSNSKQQKNRRTLIISKLAELQNDLSMLDQEEGNKKATLSSNMTVVYGLNTKINSRSAQSFNKTFCFKKVEKI